MAPEPDTGSIVAALDHDDRRRRRIAAPLRTTIEADGQVAIDVGGRPRLEHVEAAAGEPPEAQQRASRSTSAWCEEGGRVLEATLRRVRRERQPRRAMTVGPTVTRYELELAPGVKVNRVTGLSHDIAYAMASPDVRILAPIPGRSAIGVEVPEPSAPAGDARRPPRVRRGEAGDAPARRRARAATSPGRAVMLDLSTMPHLLIAGATGAGKSSCINSLVTSILMRDDARPGAADPGRPQAGRARRLQRRAPPAHPGRHQPEEGRERARLGRARDGHALRAARRGRRARHHRLQHGVRPRRSADGRRPRPGDAGRATSACRTSSSSSTSSTT